LTVINIFVLQLEHIPGVEEVKQQAKRKRKAKSSARSAKENGDKENRNKDEAGMCEESGKVLPRPKLATHLSRVQGEAFPCQPGKFVGTKRRFAEEIIFLYLMFDNNYSQFSILSFSIWS